MSIITDIKNYLRPPKENPIPPLAEFEAFALGAVREDEGTGAIKPTNQGIGDSVSVNLPVNSEGKPQIVPDQKSAIVPTAQQATAPADLKVQSADGGSSSTPPSDSHVGPLARYGNVSLGEVSIATQDLTGAVSNPEDGAADYINSQPTKVSPYTEVPESFFDTDSDTVEGASFREVSDSETASTTSDVSPYEVLDSDTSQTV